MKPSLLLGMGGHARVLLDILGKRRWPLLGFIAKDDPGREAFLAGIPVLGNDESVYEYPANSVYLINGVGTTGKSTVRRSLYERFISSGYQFATIVHPSALLADGIELAKGCQVMAGAVIQPGCFIGENSIINTRAVIDHDCSIGKHVHVAPGAVLCGDVKVEDNVMVGAGATVIQGIYIGADSIIAAGAVVVKDVPAKSVVMGVPAKAYLGGVSGFG
ncbi:acetyltransferase [Heliobacterium chlorum]|uniref:Acetyltransferase n=1 Tax=Heliobacterium chlorum TaxID=2698 RepID=A0ABR7T4E4_HELCL|nr:acetyltransferase [Heliobacterium chlorum]